MVNRCVAGGCSNTPRPGISLYKFPKDPTLRKQWERQVQTTRAKWKATETSYLCSEHFTEDCFEVTGALESQFGIKIYWRRLAPGAIPTIFSKSGHSVPVVAEHGEAAVASDSRKRSTVEAAGTAPKRTRGAVEKRQRTRVR